MKKIDIQDERRWNEIQIAASLDVRDNVRTNRTILIIALILLFGLQFYIANRARTRSERIEDKLDTLTELVFIETAVRQGIPVDSLIVEGEFKALWTQPYRKESP